MIEAAQQFEDHKAKDTTEDVTNWAPAVLYSGYGPTRPSNNGYKGSKQKQRADLSFCNSTSGQERIKPGE